jgi:two-component system cell cycle sensor histidine kinase PleC
MLADIAADCAHLVELRAQSRDLSLLLMINPSLSPLLADPRAIRQIILNLLSNAIKFTPEGGEIILEIGTTKSGCQFIKVADTGPGIPAYEIPIILESFGRGALAIKTAKEGAGLGLPIVRGLTSMHGGEFSLAAREGQGTVALITLPAERVLQKTESAALTERHAA